VKRIYKYELEITDSQVIEMPIRADILSVQVQYGSPCIWVLVDDDLVKEPRTILTFGTWNAVLGVNKFIGTYQVESGQLVFHVFEPINEKEEVDK